MEAPFATRHTFGTLDVEKTNFLGDFHCRTLNCSNLTSVSTEQQTP
jgi:hypothetical protein